MLFDKENWKDPESVMTPFWLNFTDIGWELTERVKSWLDSKDENQIAWKWQKQPCLALIPPVNASFHKVCEGIVQQIIDVLRDVDTYTKQ